MNYKKTESLETRVERLEKAVTSQAKTGNTITIDRDYFEHLLGLVEQFLYAGVHLMNEDVRQDILKDTTKTYEKGVKLLKDQ